MRYYLLKTPDIFNGDIEILRFHQQLDYRLFSSNRMYQMPSKIVLQIRHRERTEYPAILLEPLPLFNKMAWTTIQSFMKKPLHTHFIFLDEKTKDSYQYFCPAFRRARGKLESSLIQEAANGIKIYLEESLPEDLPVWYLDNGEEIQVFMALDILESLMRKDLCDIQLLPVQIMEEQVYGRYKRETT